jgi:hypothetical protein
MGVSWRADMELGHVYTLPYSGKLARLRPVSLMALVENGRIPGTLEKTVADRLWGKEPDVDEVPSQEDALQQLKFAELICTVSFTDPVIVDNPTADNEIGLEHIEQFDKLWVMEMMLGPTVALVPFRTRQGPDVEPIPDGKSNKSKAVKHNRGD